MRATVQWIGRDTLSPFAYGRLVKKPFKHQGGYRRMKADISGYFGPCKELVTSDYVDIR
jgi:hypothetical protein